MNRDRAEKVVDMPERWKPPLPQQQETRIQERPIGRYSTLEPGFSGGLQKEQIPIQLDKL